MDTLDLSYRLAVSLAGAGARACAGALPRGWRMRLKAEVPELTAGRWVWLHAVSVGELLLAEGLIGRLREAGHRVHVTTGTPAGLELLERRLPTWDQGSGLFSGGAFPLDDPTGLQPFLRQAPGAFIALETELWPGLLEALAARAIPCMVINGRLTEKTLGWGSAWMRRAASRLTLVAARDEASADSFRRLGAPTVALGGNLKADLPSPGTLHGGWEALRAAWAGAPVLVVGNSVEGEEPWLLATWAAVRTRVPDLRLILAPRQPRRFGAVADLFAERNIAFHRASCPFPEEGLWRTQEALLLDTLGDLPAVYAEGTVALVAGGWAAPGGHNPLEPVRAGVPTLIGPGYANFSDLVPPLLAAGCLQIAEAGDLEGMLLAALAVAPLRPGVPVALPETLAGALERTWALLAPQLPPVR